MRVRLQAGGVVRLLVLCGMIAELILAPLAQAGPARAAAQRPTSLRSPAATDTATATATDTPAATSATAVAATSPTTGTAAPLPTAAGSPVAGLAPTATLMPTLMPTVSATNAAMAADSATATVTATDTATVAATDTATPPALPTDAPGATVPLTAARTLAASLPLSFEENRGQTDKRVAYLAHGPGYTVFLAPTDVVLALAAPRAPRARDPLHDRVPADDEASKSVTQTTPLTTTSATAVVTATRETVVRLHLEGANAAALVEGQDKLPGTANYFVGGNPSTWTTGVPTYARVAYRAIYPGIDLVYYGTAGRLEYDYRVSPGADPTAIGFSLQGARDLRLDDQGNLVARAGDSALLQHPPVAYQDIDGQRQDIAVHYVLSGAGHVGFALGSYDTTKPLVIDPVLSYSTYLGGGGADQGYGIAVDSAGNTYITGSTTGGFPIANALQGGFAGGTGFSPSDAFVSKLNPAGTALVYSTYLGGGGNDSGNAIAVDAAGDAYVTGATASSNFPTKNAYQGAYGPGTNSMDAFVTEVGPGGNTLLYSTYLGGSNIDKGYGIAVDSAGNAYVTGLGNPGQNGYPGFPTTSVAPSTCYATSADAFVAKINTRASGGASLAYSTCVGGTSYEEVHAIAVDATGNAYVTGLTQSSNFPAVNAAQSSYGGGTDAFVTALNPSGTPFYSTYLGGNDSDQGQGIALDPAGNVYVAGYTSSGNFPTTAGAFQRAYRDIPTSSCFNAGYSLCTSAFVAKLNPTVGGGASLLYSTYLGGSATDQGMAIAVDAAGNAYLAGQTGSSDFPVTNTNTLQGTIGGNCSGSTCPSDAFVAKLNATGSALAYSTYLGGSGSDAANGIAVDGSGTAYVTGQTASSNFPTTAGSMQGGYGGGGNDAFVSRIAVPASGSVPWHPHNSGMGTIGGGVDLSVDLADGHADVGMSGMSIPGRGPDLTVERTWDSSLAGAGVGAGASGLVSNLTSSMGGALTATVSYTDGSGAVWPFVYTGSSTAAPPYTAYRTPPGQPWQLTTSTAGYTLTDILTSETWTFDGQGRLTSDTNAYGNSNSMSYGSGSATSPSGESNSGGRSLTLGYTNGQLADVQSPLWQSSGGARGQHVTYGYSGSQLTSMTRGAGTGNAATTTFGYSGALMTGITTPSGRTWALGYDTGGRVATVTSPASGTAGQPGYTPAYTTQYTYTPGQTLMVEGAGTTAAITTTYTLDAQGQAVAVADGLGNTSRSSYDANHDVTSSSDANGATTTTKYQYIGPNGAVGQVTEEDQPAIQAYSPQNGVMATPVITHSHDPSTHDLLATGQPEGGITKYAYDGHHSVVATTEQTTQNTCATTCATTWQGTFTQYDQYGERTATTDGRGVSVDANGTATLNDPSGQYTSHTGYDAQGDQTTASTPPITTTLNGITTTAPVTTTYGYDGDGNRQTMVSANRNTTTYAYDHLGRQTQVTRPAVALYAVTAGPALSSTIGTAAGTGAAAYGGDGGPATAAAMRSPPSVALDSAGDLYIVDNGNNRIREVLAGTGVITTVAGSGLGGYGGDGGPATAAMIKNPRAVALDSAGNLYIADAGNNRIREVVVSTGVITTVAGSGLGGYSGDGGAATGAMIKNPQGLALDGANNLYIADNGNNRVRKVAGGTKVISTVAGNGLAGYGGDGGAATAAGLNGPQGLAVDASGNLYIADGGNNRVREVGGSGTIVTVAGNGLAGYGGDGGRAVAATLNGPSGLALDAAGNLFIGESGNNRVRELAAISGTIGTVAGDGVAGYGGDGGPAANAALNGPAGVAVTGTVSDTLYIADGGNNRVRRVTNAQVASLTSPTEQTGYDADGNAVSATDGNGHTTTSSYDPLGRLVAETNPVSGTTLMTYTADELTAQQDPQGNVTGYGYDAAGRQIQATDPATGTTSYGYDATGNTTAITLGDTSGTVAQVEQVGYDALNRAITDMTTAPATGTLTTLTRYDQDGNVAQVQQPNGDVTYNTYDAADRLQTVEIDPAPVTKGATNPNKYESYGYDQAGNVTQSADADNRATTTQYDSDNRLIQSVDRSTDVSGTTVLTTTTGYDPNGNTLSRVTTTQKPDGTVETHTATSSYNAADQPAGSTDDGLSTSYGYDAADQVRSETTSDGATSVTTGLDAAGRVTSVAEGAGGVGPYTSQFAYNANDLPTTVSLPGGVTESASYDRNSNLTGLVAQGPAMGTVTAMLNTTYGYTYNGQGFETSETTISGTDTVTHDPATGRVTADCGPQVVAATPDHCYHWTYDKNGNITTGNADSGVVVTSTYSAAQPNALQTLVGPAGSAPTYYGYDANGDTTSITNTIGVTNPGSGDGLDTHIWYDAQARPARISKLDSGRRDTITLGYNAEGRRARYTVVVSGTTTVDERFSYRGGELGAVAVTTATLNADGSVKATGGYNDTYIYGAQGEPLEFVRTTGGATKRYFYVLDGRGSVVAVTDATGTVVDRYNYDLWGEPIGKDYQTAPQSLRYAGYWWDGEAQWYWLSGRHYDPETQRFLQPDPSDLDGVRTYVYANDDPVDVVEVGGAFSFTSFWHHAVTFLSSAAHVTFKVAEAAWNAVAGDDIHVICCTSYPLPVKALAAVDLALTVVPGADAAKLLEVGAKGAAKAGGERAAFDLVRWVVNKTGRKLDLSDDVLRRALQARKEGGGSAVRNAEKGIGCALCFPAGTLVMTPHGQQAIQTLRVGDRVLAEDPMSGTVEAEPVQAVIHDPVSPLIAVDLSDGSAITVTADHPFWVDAGAQLAGPGWFAAGSLRMGDALRTANGTPVMVVGLRRDVGTAVVYTLTVATDHTFFVGPARVLVHNCGPRPIVDKPSINNVAFDWEHIFEGHWEGSPPQIRGNNTVFHGLTQDQIRTVVRETYKNASDKLQT